LQAHLKAAPANPKTKVFKRACKANPRQERNFLKCHRTTEKRRTNIAVDK